jgi:AcrR family transcriptional regulator
VTGESERRLEVVGHALRLFSAAGYDATTVDEIAEAAGISRRTFFRQFRSKEDVVFADHETLLAQVADHLAKPHADPRLAVCEAAVLVFDRFAHLRDVARLRYEVIRDTPALREREIVTANRYERLFSGYLRNQLPDVPEIEHIEFCSALTAAHNFLLRRMVREARPDVGADSVRAAFARLRQRFAC